MYNKGYLINGLVEMERALGLDVAHLRIPALKMANILRNLNKNVRTLNPSQLERFRQNKIKKILGQSGHKILFTIAQKLYFIDGNKFQELGRI